MKEDEAERTASLMTPARLAQLRMTPRATATPTAFLDQMATDAGSGHVRRLVDLRQQIEAQSRERSHAGAARALTTLAEQLEKVDFSLLQPKGLFARVTGKGKEQGGEFLAQHDRIAKAIDDLQDEARASQKHNGNQNTAVDKTLVEFDVEVRAIEKILDQGARWLQDMRSQLKQRQYSGPDAAQQKQIDEDNARCELLVKRLKDLGGARSAGQAVHDRIHLTAGKRTGAMQALQHLINSDLRAWQEKLKPVVDAATESGSATEGVEEAKTAHQELLVAMKGAVRDWNQLTFYEKDLVDELAQLEAPLQAAA